VNYIVTARCAAGRRDHRHASLLSALDQAMSLVAAGRSEVAIIDGDGRSRTPGAEMREPFAGPVFHGKHRPSLLRGAGRRSGGTAER